MNKTRKKPANSFKKKTLFVIFISHLIIIAVIIAITTALLRPAETPELDEIISEIEQSSLREKEITGAIFELSRLAGRSGYELAVQDIVRNHDASMAVLSRNASILKTIKKQNSDDTLLFAVIAAVAAQGFFLFIFISLSGVRPGIEAGQPHAVAYQRHNGEKKNRSGAREQKWHV